MLDELMGQMKNMMAASQQQLDELKIEVEKEGIKVVCNGNKKLLDLSISKTLLEEGDKEKIEDLILATITEAMDNAEAKSKSEINGIAGNIIPGGLDGLF